MGAYFPVALNLQGRRCLVVGGGAVAERKVEALLDAGAHVIVVAPAIAPKIAALELLQAVEVQHRDYAPADLGGAFLVAAATDDRETNAGVAADARQRGVLVNAVDDAESCDFITPAVVRRGEVQVAITTSATSPALARHLRELLERLLPLEYETLAELLAEARSELQRGGTRADPETWQAAIRTALAQLRSGDTENAGIELRRILREGAAARRGRVVLVGAGPGDPGLITLAGRDAIAQADVVVYDRLVNPTLLEFARPDARLIYVGKSRGGGPASQAEINDLVCAEARAGNVVVRLKGGDPFVFGRGGEEALAAREAGIPFTVVPGVSAAIAVPAYAGIPVTHRGLSSMFTVVTAHEDANTPDSAVDWDALARAGGTLVLLMGAETLAGVCARLISAGRPTDTPAAVIQCGTTEAQRVVTGDLATIADRARAANIQAPATAVIGDVAALANVLAWREAASPESAAELRT